MVEYFTNNHERTHPNNPVVKTMTMRILAPNNSRIFKTNSISLLRKALSIFRLSKSLIVGLMFLALGIGSIKAQITQVGTTQSVYSTSTTLTLNKPTGVNVGDIMIVNIVKYKSGNTTNPSLSGWTVIASGLGGNANRIGAILYRIVDGTEGSSFAFSLGGTMSNAEGTIVAFSGIDHSSPFDVTPASITTAASTGKTVSITSITTNTPNALVLMLGMSSNSTLSTFTWSITSPVLTELYDVSGTSVVSVGAAAAIKPTVGATGTGTVTASVTTYLGGIVLVLRPQKQFQSITSGNWSSTSTWQQSTDGGATWQTATTAPASTDGLVTIQSGNTVTLSTAATASNLTINGTLDLSSNSLTGTTTMVVSSTGTLIVGGTNTFPTGFNIVTLSSGSTVNYDKSGSQTISGIGYSNLTLSGSGTKTLQTGTTSITGNLTLAGTATATAVAGLAIGADIILGSGTTFAGSTYTHNIAGNWTNNGGTFTAGSGSITLNGTTQTIGGSSSTTFNNLTIANGTTTLGTNITVSKNLLISNSGTTLASDIYQITGNATGTFTMAAGTNITLGHVSQWSNISFPTNFIAGNIILDPTSTVVFQAMDGQTVSQVPSYGNLTISGTGNSKGAANNLTINGNLTIDSNTTFSLAWTLTSMTVAKQLVNNGILKFENYPAKNVTVTGNLSGTGTIDMTQIAHTLNLNGQNNSIVTLTTDGNNSNVNYGYAGAGSQQVFASPNYRNLTISGGSAKALQGAVTVNNLLALTSGILTSTSTNSLSIANTATTAITGGSTTSFINGPVIWTLPSGLGSGSTYNFPVGNGTTYLPFALVNPTTSGTATAQVQATVGTSGGTANVDGTLISKTNTEYWNLATSANFTNSSVTITRPTAITPSDAVAGSTALAGTYTALGGTTGTNTVSNSNTIGLNQYFAFAQAQQTISTGTITGSPLCAGSVVSVPFTITGTFTSGNIFTAQLSNASGSFASPITIGTLTSTSSGIISGTIPANTITGSGYRIQVISSNPVKTGSVNGTDLTISSIPSTPTTTGATLCIGTTSTVTLSAGGAATGEKYRWYDAASGGNLLKTSTDNNDNIYTTAALGSTTNYWVSIMNAGGCESSRTQATATYPSVSTDDQNAAGTDSWIGQVYEGTNQGIAYNGSFANYYGHYTEAESFNEGFGGDATCFGFTSNSTSRSIYTATFSVRYRMNSSKKGLYAVNVGSDDGSRLTIDGNLIYSDWSDHAVNDHQNVLMNLTGTSSLLYDFYEDGGGNQVYFQNLTQLLANNLTSNTVQSIFVGNTGAAISGDIYGTLPSGVSTSGTGYQWTYSTTSGGARTAISGATGATYSPNTTIAPFNVPGTYYLYRNAVLSSTNNVSPSTYVATNESNAAVLTIIAMPVITTSATALTGFSYPVGYGPSSQLKFFTVSGVNLTTNISVLPTDSFEISLNSGVSFAPQSLITLLVNNGTVALDTIYVRMKAGFNVGNITPIYPVTCTSDNAITKNIACSGTVTILPVITVAPASLIGFIYNVGSGPSTSQSFTVSGVNLSSNLVITPPTDYEISTTLNGTYQSTPFTYTPSGGIVTSKTIYVRLLTGLAGGAYNENIVASTATSTTTVTQNIALSGSVNQPSVNVSILNLGAFIYTAGAGTTSGEQSFIVNGQYLTANLFITAPTNFEISLVSGGTFGSTISLTPTSGTVASTTIYVRMKSGIATGTTVAPINLTVTSTGAIQQNVALSGKVVSAATSISSNAALTGFVYPYTYGPSVVQSFNVSGTSLGANNITVTAPTNFEISKDASNWATSFTISPVGGLVNSVPVYVRLKAGLNVGTYSGTPITLTSSVASTVNITCSGVVITAPIVTAGPSNLGSTCNNATVSFTASGTGVTGYTWNGPNNFYSATQNPVLSNVTTANNGTYTVTGSALSGVNLLTNGDFSSGNSGFGSSYTYWATGTQNEGVYFVVANPNSMHSGFCSCADHTTGSITTGSQMVINGATSVGIIAWSESVSVVPGANYQFSYWIQNVSLGGNPGQLQLYVNGSPTGSVYTATTNEDGWFQYIGTINSGSSNVLQLTLINNNTLAGGNDFALDDIVFQQAFTVSSSVTLTVNPTLPVSVGITASISPLYSGGSVTFTASPVNGGTAPSYQWKVNGNSVGTNSITYTYTPAANDQITCGLTSNYPCTTGNPATSNILTVTARSYFWVGTNSTNWGTPSNWSGGFIPSPGNDVEYASTSNAYGSNAIRDLQLDQNRTIGSLVNATSKRLIIPAGLGLIVNNTISTNNADSLIYIKSSTTGANGSLIFHNSSASPVHATVEMYSKAFYNPLGATNQKYHWQYFGIPLTSVTASPLFDGSFVRRWEETGDSITNHWVSLANNSVLLPFVGYEITQLNATTIVFHGQLVNSDFASGQLSYTPTALFPGQHIYANPYTASIDIRQLIFGAQTEATAYLYNTGTFDQWTTTGGGNTPGNSAGQYVAVPKNTAGNSGLPRQIPSMGALLVKAMSNSSDATFGITYNTGVVNDTVPLRAPGITKQVSTDGISTIIDVAGTNYSDRMWLFTQPGCSPTFDNGWDGVKIPGIALTPQIFAIEPDGNYQVNAVEDINNTILGFQAGQDTEYTLTFTHQNLSTKYANVYLVDLLENKTVDITESGSTYSFTAESTPTSVQRFMILTRNIENDASNKNTQLKVFGFGNTIFVQNLGSLNGEMIIYDMMGHNLKKVNFGPYGVTAISVGDIPGAYVAKAYTSSESINKRIILGKLK